MSTRLGGKRRAGILVIGLVAISAGGVFDPIEAAVDSVVQAQAVAEATPSDITGADSIDDPAIWVDPADPSRSVILGADHADKSLSVYDLTGKRIQQVEVPNANNVDIRTGFPLAGVEGPIAGTAGGSALGFFTIDPATRAVTEVTAGYIKSVGAHGICMYRSPVSGRFYAFVTSNSRPTVSQYELDGSSGRVTAQLVRTIDIHPRTQDGNDAPLEGCAADDAGRSLFVGEHDWHIWRYGAEPTDPAEPADRTMVDKTQAEGGHFAPDVEGMTVVTTPSRERLLIASSQGDATFVVYKATAPYDFVRKVQIVASATADGCDRTDGVEAMATPLGPDFPHGIFICQDNRNTVPDEGAMNFKYVRLESVLPMEFLTAPVQETPQPGTPQPEAPQPEAPPVPPAASRSGYWMLGARGDVYAFGDAKVHGNTAVPSGADAVDLAPTPSGNGYWVIDSRGTIGAHDDANHHGAPPVDALRSGETVTSLSPTRTGAGYWVFTTMGRVFAYGDATHLGDMAGTTLNGEVLDSITTPSGQGYYMVAADGGIFTFGDARFLGSMGNVRLNQPVQSLVPDPDGTGYWLVASDGGVFSFDAPFRGSLASVRLNRPVTGMVPFGNGYLMVAADGGIFTFSDKPFHGSLGANPPADPITSTAALD